MEVQGNGGNRIRPRRLSFIDALKEKYCSAQDYATGSSVIKISFKFSGKPKDNGSDAELAYLRNVGLSGKNFSCAGIPSNGLTSLCPNVVDLDISGNVIDDWAEILTIFHHLPCLKFVDISRNLLNNKKNILQTWDKLLPSIENIAMNSTGLSWDEVLLLAKLLPELTELHICDNGYESLSEVDSNILKNVRCLRMNNNQIRRWEEIWKLRFLPELEILILSENPLENVFYKHEEDPVTEAKRTSDLSPEIQNDENCNNLPSSQQIKDIVETLIKDVCAEVEGMDIDEEQSQKDNTQQNFSDSNDLENSDSGLDIQDKNDSIKHEHHFCNNNDPERVVFSLGPDPEGKVDMCDVEQSSLLLEPKTGESECKIPFMKLKTLCVSQTRLSCWEDLQALSMFPALESLRCKDIILAEDMSDDDKRKMKVASLPKIKSLNGSEVSLTEREKSERHYIRYFYDKDDVPERLKELHDRHGKLKPVVDINISGGFKKWAEITFVHNGVPVFTEKINVVQLVGKLKKLIKEKMSMYCGWQDLILYHYACGPHHHGEDQNTFNELVQECLPISRFDIMEGDEIHFEANLRDREKVNRWKPVGLQNCKFQNIDHHLWNVLVYV